MIIHVDMDAFYASVEQLDNPDLKGQCVIVGGTTNRGVVSAASYEARKFGVHSAMPIFQAKKKCPQGVFVPPRMSRYKAVSQHIMAILKGYSPLVEMVSIDEAYIDIAGCTGLLGSPREIALTIKKKIQAETCLTCSVGIAPVRFLAKIASDLDKPDGLTIIHPEQVNDFIDTLVIQKVPGIGGDQFYPGVGKHRVVFHLKKGRGLDYLVRYLSISYFIVSPPVIPCILRVSCYEPKSFMPRLST